MAELVSTDPSFSASRRIAVAWFAALVVSGILIASVLVPQIREVLLDPITSGRNQFPVLLASLNIAALSAWYFTRALLYVDYPLPGVKKSRENPMRRASRVLFAGTTISLFGLLAWPELAEYLLAVVLLALLFFVYSIIDIRRRTGFFGKKKYLIPTVLTAFAGVILIVVPDAAARFVLTAICLAGTLTSCCVTYSEFQREATNPRAPEHQDAVAIWVPRVLGLMIYLPPAVVYAMNGQITFALIMAGNAVVFLAFVLFRRAGSLADFGWQAIKAVVLRPRGFARQDELPGHTYNILLVGLCGSFTMVAAILLWRSAFPQWLGTAAIMYLAAASWISFANLVLIHPARKYDTMSLFFTLPVIALGLGELFDRNQIRALDTNEPYARQTISPYIGQWLAFREDAIDQYRARGAKYPVIVVAAEGGGIRSAYWSALALARVEDEYPGFHCHIFGISGVSGGALGAVTYAGAIAERVSVARGSACGKPGVSTGPGRVADRATGALQPDFLAPIAAGLLFSDLVQAVLPVSWPDRGVFLEQTLESASRTKTPGNYMEEDFGALWLAERQYVVPALFMNATRVSDGQRIIASNIDVSSDDFVHAHDFFNVAMVQLRTSTAVHLSARFPVLSPTGVIPNSEEEDSVVDGGYYEDTGAVTAAEVLRAIDRHTGRRSDAIEIIVLRLKNTGAAVDQDYKLGQNDFLRELFGPLAALFKGHAAIGDYAESTLCDGLPAERCVVVSLEQHIPHGQETVPFAWSLTPMTEDRMNRAIATFIQSKSEMGSEAWKLDQLITRGE